MSNVIQHIRRTLGGRCLSARALLLGAILFALLAGAALVMGRSGVWSAEPEVVARVNGETVTRPEIQRVLADPIMRRQFEWELGDPAPAGITLEHLVLRKLVNGRLLLQEAGRRNLAVSEAELNQAIGALRRRFKDPQEYEAWVAAHALDDASLRKTLRDDLLITRVQAALVEGVRLSEEQVQGYYTGHREELKTVEALRLRLIVVKDKAAADKVVAALKNGEAFDRLAQERSVVSTAAQGGDMGWVSPQQLLPTLREAVATLKAGETSKPVLHDDRFLVARLEERRPSHTMSPAEARPEIERRILLPKQREALQAWLTDQKKKSKLEVSFRPESVATTTAQGWIPKSND